MLTILGAILNPASKALPPRLKGLTSNLPPLTSLSPLVPSSWPSWLLVELPAATAVRVRRETGQPDRPAPAGASGDPDEVLPSITLDYQLPVPATEAHLLLTFSTPLIQIGDAMVELFDAVAGSLTWLDGDGAHE
jgi:hypothetical protein